MILFSICSVLLVFTIKESLCLESLTNNDILNDTNVLYEKNTDPRIVGGSPAVIGQFRSTVSLRRSGQHTCGATFLNNNHVLTAAHCLLDGRTGVVFRPNEFQIVADDIRLYQFINNNRQIRDVSHVFVHQNYSIRTLINDIGVLRVSVPFIATTTLVPAIRSTVRPNDNTNCQVAGWGVQLENSTILSDHLYYVNISVINNNTCRAAYGSDIRTGMICIGNLAGGMDSCQGDSGGGTFCNNLLCGVVSFGVGCARRGYPGVYTDVSVFTNWINSTFIFNGPNSAIPTPAPGTASSNQLSLLVICMIFIVTIYL